MYRFQPSIWYLLLLFIQYIDPPFWGLFFMVCCFFCPRVRRVILVFDFTFSVLCSPGFFCVFSFPYPVVCRAFYSRSFCLRFLSSNKFQYRNFSSLSFLFVRLCSSYVLELNTLVFFLVYFLGPFCFLVFYQFLSGVKASNAGTYGSSILVQI